MKFLYNNTYWSLFWLCGHTSKAYFGETVSCPSCLTFFEIRLQFDFNNSSEPLGVKVILLFEPSFVIIPPPTQTHLLKNLIVFFSEILEICLCLLSAHIQISSRSLSSVLFSDIFLTVHPFMYGDVPNLYVLCLL